MKKSIKLLLAGALVSAAAAILAAPQFAAKPGAAQEASTEPVPAFHAQPPQDALPATMEPSLFQDIQTFNAYVVAGRVKKVLYQEPCYCHCDRSQGHGSLLDCFVSRHGSGCDICQREAFYSYEQSRRGKNATQIRDGIEKGEWQKVDVAKYQKNYLPPQTTPAK